MNYQSEQDPLEQALVRLMRERATAAHPTRDVSPELDRRIRARRSWTVTTTVAAAAATLAIAAGSGVLAGPDQSTPAPAALPSEPSDRPTNISTDDAPSTPSVTADAKAAADSDTPARGICGAATGPTATVEVALDMPTPACQQVNARQRLSVTNNTGGTGDGVSVRIAMAPFSAVTLGPGETVVYPGVMGDHLQPGVHTMQVTMGQVTNGVDVWLQ